MVEGVYSEPRQRGGGGGRERRSIQLQRTTGIGVNGTSARLGVRYPGAGEVSKKPGNGRSTQLDSQGMRGSCDVASQRAQQCAQQQCAQQQCARNLSMHSSPAINCVPHPPWNGALQLIDGLQNRNATECIILWVFTATLPPVFARLLRRAHGR